MMLAVFGCPNWMLINHDVTVVVIVLVGITVVTAIAFCVRAIHRAVAQSSDGYARLSRTLDKSVMPWLFAAWVGLCVLVWISHGVIAIYRRYWGC